MTRGAQRWKTKTHHKVLKSSKYPCESVSTAVGVEIYGVVFEEEKRTKFVS